MKKFTKILFLLVIARFLMINSFANAKDQYPNVDGQILFEVRGDRILSSKQQGIETNAGYVNIEPDFALNFNENWSVKTGVRILPMRQRQYQYPERSRFILGDNVGINRDINIDDSGAVVEELKAQFENEDMKFSAGKFNPTFATLYRRNKRIGLFTTDITEDYELREMLGFSGSALLEDSEITLSTFFQDTTSLSNSAIRRRKSRDRDDFTAANTGTLSSYSLTIEGRKFLGVENLFYNFGYRSLGVDESQDTKRETGISANLEYLHKIGRNTSIIPVIEYVQINNFTGRRNRDGEYLTTSIIAKYSGWNLSITSVFRNLDNNYEAAPKQKNRDRLLQLNVGYKFTNNIALDVSRAEIKEDGKEASALGFILSYLYEF